MKKILILAIVLVILILFFIIWVLKSKNNNSTDTAFKDNQPTKTVTAIATPTLQTTLVEDAKIIPSDNLCPQISKEFVTKVTGIAVERVSSLNDSFINACDYYLVDKKDSPYIAIIVNKNLNFEKHKQIDLKNKLVIKTDPSISGIHYIAWADKETRIANINLYLDENSFLRIDKNVERAIDNEGLMKLAIAVSKRL